VFEGKDNMSDDLDYASRWRACSFAHIPSKYFLCSPECIKEWTVTVMYQPNGIYYVYKYKPNYVYSTFRNHKSTVKSYLYQTIVYLALHLNTPFYAIQQQK
jgi:hypothetical protein